jgi:hypothetical protein
MSKPASAVKLTRKPHLPGNKGAIANRKGRITLPKVGVK